MFDSDSGNISLLGHRNWQLKPTMGKVGFGYPIWEQREWAGRWLIGVDIVKP